MKCDSADIVLTLLGWWTCFLPTAGVSALLRGGLSLTTALCVCEALRWREQGQGWAGFRAFLISLPQRQLLMARLLSHQGPSLPSLALEPVFSPNSGLRLRLCSFRGGQEGR